MQDCLSSKMLSFDPSSPAASKFYKLSDESTCFLGSLSLEKWMLPCWSTVIRLTAFSSQLIGAPIRIKAYEEVDLRSRLSPAQSVSDAKVDFIAKLNTNAISFGF